MKKKNVLKMEIFASISIGLYSQAYFIYTYNNYSHIVERLLAALVISVIVGIMYYLLVDFIFKKLIAKNEYYGELQRRFTLSHLPILGLNFYPLQFVLKSDLFNEYFLATTVLGTVLAFYFYFILPLFRFLHPELIEKGRKIPIIFYWPFLFVLILVLYFYLWHYGVAYIYLDMQNFDRGIVRGPMTLLLLYYLIFSLLLLLAVYFFSNSRFTYIRIIFYLVFLFFGFFSIFARVLDFGTFLYSGAHVDHIIWSHFWNKENIVFFTTPSGFAGIVAVLLFILFIVFLINKAKDFRKFLQKLKPFGKSFAYVRRLSFAVNFSIILFAYLIYYILFYMLESPFSKKYDAAIYLKIPEVHVFTSLLDYLMPEGDDNGIKLSNEIKEKCRKSGIILESVSTEYPLLKRSIYVADKKLRDVPKLAKGTNIVIVFAESFSKYFTTQEMHGIKGLTPEIDDFKRHSLTFENMYNIIAPTITGIIATMGSFPYYVEKYNITQNNRLTNLKFSFLSEILKKHGYYCLHIQGSSSDFASTETIFKNHGFDDFISLENPQLRSFARDPISKWGLRDRDLFRYVVKKFSEKSIKEPFLVTISTIDLHPPYHLSEDDRKFSDPIFDCVYSTDEAFGIFWEYFKNSPYYENTIVLFIADHAMVMNPKYFKLRGETFNRARQDTITSILYLPGCKNFQGNKNYTYATNLDIAPTFCDILGIDEINSFMGLSIFSERTFYPYVPGEIMLDGIFKAESGKNRIVNFTNDEHREIYNYIKNLALKNRVFPAKITGDLK
ncbi:MAG TPA: LTA synthase family protein [Spirochaetota bacterium]|nr:LTA synthase family protein [Spirochaetota bacterium]